MLKGIALGLAASLALVSLAASAETVATNGPLWRSTLRPSLFRAFA